MQSIFEWADCIDSNHLYIEYIYIHRLGLGCILPTRVTGTFAIVRIHPKLLVPTTGVWVARMLKHEATHKLRIDSLLVAAWSCLSVHVSYSKIVYSYLELIWRKG